LPPAVEREMRETLERAGRALAAQLRAEELVLGAAMDRVGVIS
jgi:hypothetical protein